MSIEHKDIPDSERHEPKGASTALSGTVYVSDGAGSGSWVIPEPKGAGTALEGQQYFSDGAGSGQWLYPVTGWANYADSAGVSQVLDTTPTILTINSLGANTDEDHLPREIRGVTSLWDNVDNLITPIAVGDSYDVRIDLTVTAITGVPTYILFQLDIGTAGVPNIIMEKEIQFNRTSPPIKLNDTFEIFCKDTFLANGGAIKLSVDTGTATIGARQVFISRNHGERP